MGEIMKALAALFFPLALSGCLGMDVVKMEAAQLRSMEGMVVCNKTAVSAYGQSVIIVIKDPDVRKGATGKSKITMSPDCATTIENDVGVAPLER